MAEGYLPFQPGRMIESHFIGPTNYRGARVKARSATESIVLPWDDGLGVTDNHCRAIDALARKLGWTRGQAAAVIAPTRGGGYVAIYTL